MGKSVGTNTGTVIANFDEMPSHYQGVAYLLDDNGLVPGSVAFFSTDNKDSTFRFRAIIKPIDPKTGVFTNWDNIKQNFQPDVQVPEYADMPPRWQAGMAK